MSSQEQESDAAAAWDAEEDHMLSYFLGDVNGAQTGNGMIPALATPSERGPYATTDTINSALEREPPATPAVQFYTSTPAPKPLHQPQQVRAPASVVSTSSSSSSLSSMAATLVSGGPVMQQYAQQQQQHQQQQHQQQRQTTTPPSAASPISPAATIGSAQEQLMLPPPPREKTEAEKQQHRVWLQQINSMARMSSAGNPPGAPLHVPRQPNVVVPGMPTHGYPTALAPNPVYQPGMVMAQQARFHPPHHPHHHHPHHHPHHTIGAPAPMESEEKRARRLARNRESARQSRRRKKEKLVKLAGQVNQLHTQIEEERRRKLDSMEESLQRTRLVAISELQQDNNLTEHELQQRLYALMQATGPNCNIRQNALSFQYNTLKQTVLPTYREFILWLTTHREGFFMAGKEHRTKTDAATGRGVGGRVSSKQIGEEITNQWKAESKMGGDGTEVRCDAFDAARLWPLFCYEMSVSVDQEEKMLQFHRRVTETPTLRDSRVHVGNVAKMAMTLKKGLLVHSHSTAARTENTLLRAMTPEQSTKFLNWCAKNKERYKEAMRERQAAKKETAPLSDSSLTDICQRLDDALRLPPVTDSTLTF